MLVHTKLISNRWCSNLVWNVWVFDKFNIIVTLYYVHVRQFFFMRLQEKVKSFDPLELSPDQFWIYCYWLCIQNWFSFIYTHTHPCAWDIAIGRNYVNEQQEANAPFIILICTRIAGLRSRRYCKGACDGVQRQFKAKWEWTISPFFV